MARAGTKRPSLSPDSDQDEEDREDRGNEDIKRVKIEKGLAGARRAGTGRAHSTMSVANGVDDDTDDLEEESEDESEQDEPEYGEEALFEAYQASKEKRKGYVGSVAEAGIIKSISLVDFMCHRHLTVEFGPKMNFLVGHNGSGKSAVLTAIAVVLGGKAATTGRGQGMKDLIRKGADKATITLVMANDGPEAFKPDIYNPYIVIERIISSNGSSQYKFRATKDGKTLATKRSELTALSEQFTINIDSPLTILTQDQSRSFLQNADSHKLYKFFLEGTQLAAVANVYEASKQNISQLDNHIKRQVEALPDLRMKVSTLKRKLDASSKILKQKDKLKTLLDELAWAYVSEKQIEKARSEAEVDKWQRKVDVVQTEINKAEKLLPLLDDEARQTEIQVQNFNQSRQPLERAVREAKEKYEQTRRDLRAAENDIKDCKADIASEQEGLDRIQRKIDEKLRQNPAEQQQEQARLMERRSQLENLVTNLKREKPLLMERSEERRQEKGKIQAEIDELSRKIQEEDNVINRNNQTIGNLERQSVNRLSAFGHGLDDVMKEIQRTRWNHSPPLGPLGMHVKLNDMTYKDPIHSILGQLMCSFAVRDPRDRDTLSGLLRRHAQRGYRPGYPAPNGSIPPIFMHSGDMFDFSRGDLRSHGPTILSKLTIDNDHVLRIMINVTRIERIFLSPTLVQANKEMTRLLEVLPECQFYTADERQTSGSRTGRGSGPYPKWQGNTLFSRNVNDDIERVRHIQRECETRRRDLQTARDAAQQKVADLEQNMKTIMDNIKQVNSKIGPATMHLDKINKSLAEMVSSDIEIQEGLREEARSKIEAKEAQLQKFESDREEVKRLLAERAQEIKDRQEEVDAHAPQRGKMQERLASLLVQVEEKRTSIAHYGKSRANYELKQRAEEERLAEHERNLEDWTAKASGFCPERVETDRSPKIVGKEKNALEQSINDAEKQLGIDTNQLMLEYVREKNRLGESEKSLRQFKVLHKILCRAIKARQTWWSDARSHMSLRARTAFLYFESLRDLDGRLEFDHDCETLDLVVHTTTHQETEAGLTQKSHYKSPKTLSGGERSFSTVSLLLALWHTVPCSIRALDEWDVFLDAANRKVAAGSLMDGARESDGKQFILITPQDMAGIDVSGPDKKVIRMADPTRNQGTLPFGPAA